MDFNLNDIDVDKILKICEEFLEIPSVVGFERPFLIYLNEKAKNLGFETNLTESYLYIKSKIKSNILFSAHIDRQGMVLNENQNIEYATNYMKRKNKLKFRREEQEESEINLVEILNNLFNKKNIIENEKYTVKLDDYFIRFKNDFSKESLSFFRQDGPVDAEKIALRYVGENIISYNFKGKEYSNHNNHNNYNKYNKYKIIRYDLDWKKHLIEFSIDKENIDFDKEKVFMLESKISIFKDKFSGQIDNVISVAVLFYLLKFNENFNANLLFTIGEEMGESYKSILNFYSDFDKNYSNKLIVLDTSPYYDFNNKIDGFLVLRHGDERGGFNQILVEQIKSLLIENSISFDFKPSYLGRTELGKVALKSKGKINGTTLQLPSLNYHTSYETSTINSLKNYAFIINEIVKKFN